MNIIKRYHEHGLAGSRDCHHDNLGAPNLLSDEDMLQLARLVREDFDKGIVWNGAKVVQWLRDELGKEVHISRAYDCLAAIGFSPQKPRPVHAKADQVEQETFKKDPT